MICRLRACRLSSRNNIIWITLLCHWLMQTIYSREGNKRGGSLTVFQKFSRPILIKMSEISINTVENIDEIDQIIFLTTCTTKLHRYYRVTLHSLDFQQKKFPEIPSPFNYLRQSNLVHVCYISIGFSI